MKITPNRIVVLITPIFVGVSGWVVEWVATNLPGAPHLNAGGLTALMVLGALAGLGAALKWLHGWQKHEGRTSLDRVEVDDDVTVATVRPKKRKVR